MTTITDLPTVNFDSNPGLDEFQFLHKTYSNEFRWRTSIGSNHGIVDSSYAPSSAPFTVGRPLLVSISPINPLAVDIAAGFAVTPSGCLINVDSQVSGLTLPLIASGKTYVVLTEYVLVPSEQTRINRAGDLVEVRLERPSNDPVGSAQATLTNAITIVNINDYTNPALFTQERLDNLVVLSIVSVLNDENGLLYLTLDLTKTIYEFNRPWFSFIDVEHRTKIGNGIITENNPHGLDIGDLSSQNLTLYQQLLDKGGVFAKDISYYGYAGHICSEIITISRIESDLTGEVSGDLGGRYYVRLNKIPVRTGSLYIQGQPWVPIPYEWKQGTSIILLGPYEDPTLYTSSLIMEYFNVTALEPSEDTLLTGIQTFEVGTPLADSEYIIANGLATSTLTQTSVALASTLGAIKRQYKAYCDGSGALVFSPQPILASLRVADLTGTPQTVNQAVYAGTAVPLTVGLTGTQKRSIKGQSTYDLNLKLVLTGIDQGGATIQESIAFTASTWRDQVKDIEQEEPMQFVTTLNRFQLLSSISTANTTSTPSNVGQLATLTVWANIIDGVATQELAPIAGFFWTGDKGGQRVKDERRISTTLSPDNQRQWRKTLGEDLAATQELFSIILSPPLTENVSTQLLLAEMDDDRQFGETWETFSTSRASGVIQYINDQYFPYAVGMTIRISDGKYLKFVSGTANTSMGEVLWSTTPSVLASNMVTTINDPMWESKWTSVLGTGSLPSVTLAREEAYPDGFSICQRVEMSFTDLDKDPSQSLTFSINNVEITSTPSCTSTVPLVTTDDVLRALVAAINSSTGTQVTAATHGVSAILRTFEDSTSTSTIILNGEPDGQPFTISDLASNTYGSSSITGPVSIALYDTTRVTAGPTAALVVPVEAFSVTQPSGGSLSTGHLPVRNPSYSDQWTYLTRPLLWENLVWEAKLRLTNDTIANISDGDAIEVAPFKVIIAKKSVTPDPSLGQFAVGVDLQSTLQNIADTINSSKFVSGIRAEVFQDVTSLCVKLVSEGKAATTLRIVLQRIAGTWLLEPWIPLGAAKLDAFIRAIYPLEEASWRVRVIAPNHTLSSWSTWMALDRISPNAFRLSNDLIDGGGVFSFYGDSDHRAKGFSDVFHPSDGGVWLYNGVPVPPPPVYTFQIRLKGDQGQCRPNGFSLYKYVPEVTDSDITGQGIRLTAVEGEIADARGDMASLDARISVAVTSSGLMIQDPELTDARVSTAIMPSATVKRRLDGTDALLQLIGHNDVLDVVKTQGAVPDYSLLSPVVRGENMLVRGPTQTGASNFLSTVGTTLNILGTETEPLVVQVNGRTYLNEVNVPISFSGKNAGTYYVYADVASPMGKQIIYIQESGSISSGGNVFTEPDGSLLNNAVKQGHLLVITSETVRLDNGFPLITYIDSVNAGINGSSTLTVSGRFPKSASGLTYYVFSPREASFHVESVRSADSATRHHIGEVVWAGTEFTSYRSYRYGNKYVSPITSVTPVNGNYLLSWDHNLGYMPRGFTVYYYENSSDSFGKVLNIGDEAVAETDTLTLRLRNRYVNLIARSFSGENKTTGYLQLIAF